MLRIPRYTARRRLPLIISTLVPLFVAGVAIVVAGTPAATHAGAATATPTRTSTPTPAPTPAPFAWSLAIDCDPATAGVQSACNVGEGRISVDVVLKNVSGPPARLGAVGWEARTNNSVLAPVTLASCDASAGLDCNPDFDQASVTGSWACSPPPPVADRNYTGDPPSLVRSIIGCWTLAIDAVTVGPGESLRLGSMSYDAVPGVAEIAVFDGNLYDAVFAELGSCPYVISVEMTCANASITVVEAPPITATPCADSDCDGIPDAIDNCPTVANASQANSDGNRMRAPGETTFASDHTRPLSDEQGNDCDADDDNDGLADTEEGIWDFCGGPEWYTEPTSNDGDEDRFLDGIECDLGINPSSWRDTPPLSICGAATDSDGDKLSDRAETCAYGTNPNSVDSDGDGTRDGCEAASMNADTIVNAADLGIIANFFHLRPGFIRSGYVIEADVNKDGVVNVADLGLASTLVAAGRCP